MLHAAHRVCSNASRLHFMSSSGATTHTTVTRQWRKRREYTTTTETITGANSDTKKRVVVAMSGGVDSSVAAYLLKQQGHEVIGIHMSNWSEQEEKGFCTGEKDMKDAANACRHLGIPLQTVSFEREYWNNVFEPMLHNYSTGMITPNPDILCNREIKFKVLLEKALTFGDYLATGHYAQIKNEDGNVRLMQARDKMKDQTYFLMQGCVPEFFSNLVQVSKTSLSNVMFPVGGMLKTEVKELAEKIGLPNATKKESMGICFVGKRKFDKFLSEYIPKQPGYFIDVDTGKVLGDHNGLPFYTHGQGANIGGLPSKYFVVSKDSIENTITVCEGTQHPALFSHRLIMKDIHWIDQQIPESLALRGEMRCQYKIRHPGIPKEGTLRLLQNSEIEALCNEFDTPERGVTPGQMAGLYDTKGHCLGGGEIHC